MQHESRNYSAYLFVQLQNTEQTLFYQRRYSSNRFLSLLFSSFDKSDIFELLPVKINSQCIKKLPLVNL